MNLGWLRAFYGYLARSPHGPYWLTIPRGNISAFSSIEQAGYGAHKQTKLLKHYWTDEILDVALAGANRFVPNGIPKPNGRDFCISEISLHHPRGAFIKYRSVEPVKIFLGDLWMLNVRLQQIEEQRGIQLETLVFRFNGVNYSRLSALGLIHHVRIFPDMPLEKRLDHVEQTFWAIAQNNRKLGLIFASIILDCWVPVDLGDVTWNGVRSVHRNAKKLIPQEWLDDFACRVRTL